MMVFNNNFNGVAVRRSFFKLINNFNLLHVID